MSLSGSKVWKDTIQLQRVSQLPWFGPSTMAEIKTPPNLLLSSAVRVRCHAAKDFSDWWLVVMLERKVRKSITE
jgi:hypothetical protein